MNFKNLLDEKRIERVESSEVDFSSVFGDIVFARNGMSTGNYDRVMAVAYEAVLRAGNKFMNFLGYRAIGKEHHKNLFEFLRQYGFDSALVDYFDKIRKRRNAFVYRDIENVSKSEAEEIIIKSEGFVQKIRTLVQKIRTGFGGENEK